MAPKTITVKCPQCQQVYIDWYIPAVTEPPPEALSPSTVCSQCGHRSRMSELKERDGTWQAKR